jgi:hypothetical protein
VGRLTMTRRPLMDGQDNFRKPFHLASGLKDTNIERFNC